MIPATNRHARILSAIRTLTRGGVPPSYDELCAELGMRSKGGLHGCLVVMRDRGLVTFTARARSLRVLGQFDDLRDMPTSELLLLFERARVELRRRAS